MSSVGGLGYEGSKNLYRSAEGIRSDNNNENFPVFRLLNYPITAIFSGRAIRKMDREFKENSNCSTISIKANFASGKKVHLLSINTNFFGRVQADRNTIEPCKKYQVPPFLYDPADDSFESQFSSQRSFGLDKETISKDDILTSFDARYLLGYVCANKTFEFSKKYFSSLYEKLQLEIDVSENDEWILNICQIGKVNNNQDLAEVKDIDFRPEDFICPLTKKVMENPVQDIAGNNYEKEAILEYIKCNPKVPLKGVFLFPDHLMPNEELKKAIAKYKLSKNSTPALSSSQLPPLGPVGMSAFQAPQKELPASKEIMPSRSAQSILPKSEPNVEILEDAEDEEDPLTCPITLEMMKEPVMASDGHTYERKAIIQWIQQHGTSPKTREPLTIESLKTNYAIKKLIQLKNAKN